MTSRLRALGAATAVAIAVIVCRSAAQAPAAGVTEFDTVSFKRAAGSSSAFAGSGFGAPTFFRRSTSLRVLVADAYGVGQDRVTGGPSWIDTDRYDVEASAGGVPLTPDVL